MEHTCTNVCACNHVFAQAPGKTVLKPDFQTSPKSHIDNTVGSNSSILIILSFCNSFLNHLPHQHKSVTRWLLTCRVKPVLIKTSVIWCADLLLIYEAFQWLLATSQRIKILKSTRQLLIKKKTLNTWVTQLQCTIVLLLTETSEGDSLPVRQQR